MIGIVDAEEKAVAFVSRRETGYFPASTVDIVEDSTRVAVRLRRYKTRRPTTNRIARIDPQMIPAIILLLEDAAVL